MARENWIEAIGKAEDLFSVFELANQALVERLSWGDDPVGGLAAALQWAQYLFPIDALDSGAVIGHAKVERDGLLRASLAASKAVAQALLTPLPARPEVDEKRSETRRRANWVKASEDAIKAACVGLRSVKGCQSVYPPHVFGKAVCRGSQERCWETAAGVEAKISAQEALFSPARFNARFIDVDKQADLLMDEWEQADANPDAIKKILNLSGASFALAGPAGGASAIAKGAFLLSQNYEKMAALTGAPAMALGLGLEGMAWNMSPSTSHAYYISSSNMLAFSHLPAHLGHEWTHLLEERIKKSGSAQQKAALRKLLKAPFEIAPDKELLRRSSALLFKEASLNMENFLKLKGREASRQQGLEPLDSPEDEQHCSEVFLEAAKRAASSGEEAWGIFLESHRDPESAPLQARGVAYNYEILREAMGLSENSKNRKPCFFLSQAQELDVLNDKRYLAKPGELMARVSEVYFARLGAPASISMASEGQPEGEEAIELCALYEQLLKTFKAEPGRLLGARGRAHLLHLERSKPEALAATGLKAWRAERDKKSRPAKPWGSRQR